MKIIQLTIFSWQTDKIDEANQYLTNLDFDNAIINFQEVFEKFPENTIAENGLQIANFWRNIFLRSEFSDNAEGIKFFYYQINNYSFDNSYQSKILKKSLLEYLIDAMNNKEMFFLSDTICIADIYALLIKYKKAESVFKKYLKEHQDSALIRCRLADIQWIQGIRKEANKNYAIALLTCPNEILIDKIENKELIRCINDNGAEMAPAYGWLSGILPFIDITKLNLKKFNSKFFDLYHTLFLAEKSRKENNTKFMIEYRKHIKEIAPVFYDKYYKWLSQFNIRKFVIN